MEKRTVADGPVRRHAHRREHMRRLHGADQAGRAARDGQAREIEADEQVLAMQAQKTDVERVGQARTDQADAPLRRTPPSELSSCQSRSVQRNWRCASTGSTFP